MLLDLIKKNRSFRRFAPGYVPDTEALRSLVEYARFSATGKNKQTLRFRLVNEPGEAAAAYNSIKGWKMMLPGWAGQAENERPPAYIIILNDSARGNCLPADVGIAAQSITLGAAEQGLGCCMILSFNKKELCAALALPEGMQPELMIAVGKPGEEVLLDDLPKSGDTAYWEDDARRHYVPKRALEDLLV